MKFPFGTFSGAKVRNILGKTKKSALFREGTAAPGRLAATTALFLPAPPEMRICTPEMSVSSEVTNVTWEEMDATWEERNVTWEEREMIGGGMRRDGDALETTGGKEAEEGKALRPDGGRRPTDDPGGRRGGWYGRP